MTQHAPSFEHLHSRLPSFAGANAEDSRIVGVLCLTPRRNAKQGRLVPAFRDWPNAKREMIGATQADRFRPAKGSLSVSENYAHRNRHCADLSGRERWL
jgi:hypothetical protein